MKSTEEYVIDKERYIFRKKNVYKLAKQELFNTSPSKKNCPWSENTWALWENNSSRRMGSINKVMLTIF